jgi:SAM-dependent methyltransferase
VWGKKVIDLGCGTGYGTYMLSWGARQAVGVDIDVDAIAFAAAHFQAPNLTYAAMDITRRGFNGEIYVAFEVLEHLDDPAALIAKYRPLLWSMPIDDDSRFHKRGYSWRQIRELTGDINAVQNWDGDITIAQTDGAKYALGLML